MTAGPTTALRVGETVYTNASASGWLRGQLVLTNGELDGNDGDEVIKSVKLPESIFAEGGGHCLTR